MAKHSYQRHVSAIGTPDGSLWLLAGANIAPLWPRSHGFGTGPDTALSHRSHGFGTGPDTALSHCSHGFGTGPDTALSHRSHGFGTGPDTALSQILVAKAGSRPPAGFEWAITAAGLAQSLRVCQTLPHSEGCA